MFSKVGEDRKAFSLKRLSVKVLLCHQSVDANKCAIQKQRNYTRNIVADLLNEEERRGRHDPAG